MKKVRIIILFMTLLLGMFFLMPAKVFASDDVLEPENWFNHISQFEFGFAKGEIDDFGTITIVEEPSHEYDGWSIWYSNYDYYESTHYFAPELAALRPLLLDGDGVLWYLEENYENFDGYFYWNFEQKYWQVEYYGTSELGYYKQRVEELEDEIQQLEDEIEQLENENQQLVDEKQQLEDEIEQLENENQQLVDEKQQLEDEIEQLENEKQQLEDEISLLQNEIQRLEEALELEYDRGYNDGYEIGYSEGLLVENNDIDIIRWFVPLVIIIIVVGIIEPIILVKRRG